MFINVDNLSKQFRIPIKSTNFIQKCVNFISPDYRTVYALKNINFSLKKGEIVGLIGPNGSGKSTLIKIMTGILHPSGGICVIDGVTPWLDRIKCAKKIGVVFGQKSQLLWDLPPIDSFNLLKAIYDIDGFQFEKTLKELIDFFDLHKVINTPTRLLSLGQRTRCEIVSSLLHNPQILFLDEPSIGLDAETKILLRTYVKRINHAFDITVIIATHDMLDIENICDRVIAICSGEMCFIGPFNDLISKYSLWKELVVLYENANIEMIKKALGKKYDILYISPNKMLIRFKFTDICYKILEDVSELCNIISIDVKNRNLDEVLNECYKNFKKGSHEKSCSDV